MRSFVPGSRKLSQEALERIMYYFVKEAFPRNHSFFEQGEVMDGSVYFIWQGSVETYSRDLHTGGFMRMGILMPGSLFAGVPQGGIAQFSAVAMSADCEVLRVKPESKRHLPDCIVGGLRDVLEATVTRRTTECTPLSPMGSAFGPRPMTIHGSSTLSPIRHRESKLQPPRNEKVPRPLSGRMPGAGYRHSFRPNTVGGSLRKTCSLPCFSGLFQRVVTEVDYEAFNLEPGETLAMTAKKPRRREKRGQLEDALSSPESKLSGSFSSLPSLGGGSSLSLTA